MKNADAVVVVAWSQTMPQRVGRRPFFTGNGPVMHRSHWQQSLGSSFRGALILLVVGMSAGVLLVAQDFERQEGPAVKVEDYPEIPPRGYVCYRAPKAITIDEIGRAHV